MFRSRSENSHIQCRQGTTRAADVKARSTPLTERFRAAQDPAVLQDELLHFDRELHAAGLNPGTSAELTAASILVYLLTAT